MTQATGAFGSRQWAGRSPARGMLAALGLLFASRMAILAGLGWATGGSEFTADAQLAFQFAADPFAQLMSRASTTPYPPLLPLVTAFVLAPFRILPPFYSIRVVFALFELAAAAVTWWALVCRNRTPSQCRAAMAVWIGAPIGWVATVVMAQDEALAAAFAAAATLLLVERRPAMALLASSAGVVAAKIFFLCPLAALAAVARKPSVVRRLLAAGAPLGVYAVPLLVGTLSGRPLPFTGFVLAIFGVNLWAFGASWLGIPNPLAHKLSAPIALGATLALAAAARRSIRSADEPPPPDRLVALTAASLLCTFLLFYHVNPEYYLIVLPPVLVLYTGWKAVAAAVALSLPWLENFFFGVGGAMARGDIGGSQVFVRVYRSCCVAASPAALERLSVVVAVACLLLLATSLVRRATTKE
ncbi:MAG: hypothetical protein ACE148_15705 [Vicinamibacterales bacterium]